MKFNLHIVYLLLLSSATLADNATSLRLFREVQDMDGVIIAPTILSDTLSLLYCGSNGKTSEEFKSCLFPKTSKKKIISEVKSRTQISSLVSAGTIWIDDITQLNDDFKRAATKYWNFHIGSVPLQKDPDQCVEIINDWFEEKIWISNVIGRHDIPSQSSVMIISRIRFEALWGDIFKDDMKEKLFYTENENSFPVSMMNGIDSIPYYEDDTLQSVVVPCTDSDLRFMLLLPKPDNTLSNLSSSLDSALLKNIHNSFKSTLVDLSLPHVSCNKEIEWREVLIKLGLQAAFTPELADFHRINNNEPFPLFLDSIKQNVSVYWDTERIFASACTISSMEWFGIDGTPKPEPVRFNADHPFIFLIYQPETMDIHFIGSVSKQSQMPLKK